MAEPGGRRRSGAALVAITLAGALLVAVFSGLGVWQVERLAWKTALIERLEARLAADPVAAPDPAEWAAIGADTDEYRRVALTGTFDHDAEARVQAVTAEGPGFWVVTPLRRDTGDTVLVNRGFVPADRADPSTRPEGQVAGETTITGLLRLTEPGGAFLRENDPAADRWFSRDVAAIGETRGIDALAPYFVDADRTPNPGGLPVGGLTVVAFSNNHLIYALTWFSLALMVLGAVVFVHRDARRRAEAVPEPA